MAKDADAIEADFLALYDESADALFRHCYFRVSDRELARDLTQEAFTRTWEYLASGKSVSHLRAFLFRTAGNLVIDHYRRKKEISLEALADAGFDPSGDEYLAIPELAAGREAMQAVALLDEGHKHVILLRYVDGLSIGEIALIRKESENAVSVRIHRALKKLNDLLHHARP